MQKLKSAIIEVSETITNLYLAPSHADIYQHKLIDLEPSSIIEIADRDAPTSIGSITEEELQHVLCLLYGL